MAGNTPDSHSMTTIDTSGGDDGAQDTPNAQDNNTQPQPRDSTASNRGGESQQAPGGSGSDENQDNGEGEGAAAEPELDAEGNPVDGEFVEGEEGDSAPLDPKSVSEMIQKGIEEALAKNKPVEQVPQLTDEQWAAKEAEVGTDRKAIQFFTAQSMKVYNAVQNMLDERFAKIEKDGVLRSLSRTPGFQDAMRYPKGIEAYLSRIEPRYHSNPDVLKLAVIHARGLASGKNVQRARVESERNRRIAGVARPAAPGNSSGSSRGARPAAPALNNTQREVARKFNMTDAEYSKLKNGSKVVSV